MGFSQCGETRAEAKAMEIGEGTGRVYEEDREDLPEEAGEECGACERAVG